MLMVVIYLTLSPEYDSLLNMTVLLVTFKLGIQYMCHCLSCLKQLTTYFLETFRCDS